MKLWLNQNKASTNRPRFSAALQAETNLDGIDRAWKMIHSSQRRWLTKATLDLAPTGKNMHTWGFWPHNRCPCCQQANETTPHLLQCQEASAKIPGRQDRTGIQYPTTSDHDIASTPEVLDGDRPRSTKQSMTADPDIQQAVIEQGQIGRIEMFLGKTSKKWMDIQEAY